MKAATRPFRFGLLTKGAQSAKAWVELLQRVQGSGFSTLQIPLHTTPQFAPFVALADAAARTSLTVGTLVHNNDLLHPGLLARDAMTLAVLSEGRFELGIGAGWMERDYQQLGLQMDIGGRRVDRLAEAIGILRAVWTGQRVSCRGTHYTVEDLQGPRGPRIPLLVGAGGTRMLCLAAHSADIVSISRHATVGSTPEQIAADVSLEATEQKIAVVRGCRADRAADFEFHVLVVSAGVGSDADRLIQRLAVAGGVTEAAIGQTPEHLLARDTAEMRAQLVERRERTGINYYSFRDVHLDNVMPVVELLAGT